MELKDMFDKCAEMGERASRQKLLKEMLEYASNDKIYDYSDQKLLFNFLRHFAVSVVVTDKRINTT